MTAGSAKTALRLDRITKRYGDFVAVDSLSLTVPLGTIFGILGPNGAGKTTTLRMINDIIRPDEGEIRVLDEYRPGREAARFVGYLPEERGLYPKMRVGDVLEFFGELRGLSRKEANRRADKWLERLELSQWKTNKLQDLSKGMQQKIQFVTGVIHEPKLLILDEPWSGLDPINAEVLREIVQEQKAAGRTILFSTHMMEQAEKLCDHVFIIARGKKIVDGELSAVKRAAAGDRLIALVLSDGQGEPAVLRDAALVAGHRERKGYLEVELAAGVEPDALLAALVDVGAKVRRFEMIEPSLHQIFVDKVGEAQASGAARA